MAQSSGRSEQEIVISLTALILFLQFDTGGTFSMLSRGQLYVMNSGESIDLDCEFYTKYFNLFDNPVLWIKTQHHEQSRINIMGNINEPFVNTGRFKVTFLPSPPRYRLVLSIEGLALEDSGNYTCEVRGPETSVLAAITHKLFIRAPVQDLIVNKDNCTDSCDPVTPSTLSFIENKPTLLQCVATGGNPPPEIIIFLDDFDITYRFKSETYTRLLGSDGLKIMHSSVHTRTRKLMLSADDDGKMLRCQAEVPGLPKNVTQTQVRVMFSPVIRCESSVAYDNVRNVYVSCEVKSRPHPSTLFWIIDENGTTLHESQIINDYWTLVNDRMNGVIETKLFIKKTIPESFKTYTIVAENSVGIKRQDVELMRKMPEADDMGNDLPYYSSHDNGWAQGEVEYIFIPANGYSAKIASSLPLLLLAFHVHAWSYIMS